MIEKRFNKGIKMGAGLPRASYSPNIWKLNAIRSLFWMHFFGPVLVPFFTQWGGLTLAQVFYMNAWFFFCNFLFEVPTGAVADFVGRKASLALGSLLGGAAAFFYTSRPLLAVFLVAEAVFALAFTFHSGADEALAYDSLKAMRQESSSKKVLSRMEAFKLGGILFADLIGGYIAERWGLTAPLRVTGVAIFSSFGSMNPKGLSPFGAMNQKTEKTPILLIGKS